MKKLFLIAILFTNGCTNTYEYRQVDKSEVDWDYESRTVTTTVSETTTLDSKWGEKAANATLLLGNIALIVVALK
jgi:hypothetical protein